MITRNHNAGPWAEPGQTGETPLWALGFSRFIRAGASLLVCVVMVSIAISSWAHAGDDRQPVDADIRALFSAPGVVPEKMATTLTDAFRDVVFGSEIKSLSASTVLAKWQGPVGIEIKGRAKEQHLRFLETHLRTVSRLTGLRFHQVGKGKPPAGDNGQKISFVFVHRDEMGKIKIPGAPDGLVQRLASEGGCYFITFKKPEWRLVRSIIVVNVDRDTRNLNACLLEELVQSLGLPNDSNIIRPSVFSDYDRLTALAPADRALLRAVYDPRMKAGLGREDAVLLAHSLFREMAGP